MRRGGPGLAALDRSLHSSAQYSSLGSELTTSQLNELRSQLDTFSNALRQFANKHRRDIVRDPDFRHAFQQMCANIGVDPLAGGGRQSNGALGRLSGMWNDFLGLSDFQHELSIQVIDICVSSRDTNGGYIEMQQLLRAINDLRNGVDASQRRDAQSGLVTEEDVAQSIQLLQPLGSGYEIIQLPNGIKMVRSLPQELDTDASTVIAMLSMSSPSLPRDASGLPYITEQQIRSLSWTADRASAVLVGMLLDGLLWIDEGVHPPRYYALSTLTNALR